MKLYDTYLFKLIRLILFYLTSFMMLITIYILFIVSNIYCNILKNKNKSNINHIIIYRVIRFYLKLLFWINITVDGNLNKPKNIIVTTNHISLLDSIILLSVMYNNLDHKINILIMHRYLNMPILGYILKSLDFIPVGNKEYNKNIDLNRKIINNLQNGNSLYIFFEGSRNVNPTKLQPIKPGIFNYHKYSNGIKFIGIKGIDKIWPHNGYPTGYGTIKIKFFDGLYKFDTFEETQDKIHELYDNYIL